MSSIVGINAGFAGTGPYRITTPTVTADASGGLVQANANTKFSTNLPVGMGMLVTDIEWISAFVKPPVQIPGTAGSNVNIWQDIGQLTEALARTAVAQTDPVDIDFFFDELGYAEREDASGQTNVVWNRQKAFERHHLWRPWLSIGQQLNLVHSIIPRVAAPQNGPQMDIFCRIYFDLVALSAAQQAYLAQRIQISGQA